MRILLVDDDSAFVMGAQELLERAGHEVDVKWDGSAAVLAVRHDRPDVVVLDFRMPGFNGEETARLMRTLSPGVRIIGISAAPENDTGWADLFVAKQDVPDRLLDAIQGQEQSKG